MSCWSDNIKEVMKGSRFPSCWRMVRSLNDDFCIHGNPNVLTEDIGTSSLAQGPSAHSTLVQIKKYTKDLPLLKFLIYLILLINRDICFED